jgi:hypothetical protein
MDATRTAPELGTAVSPPAATWKGGATASDVAASSAIDPSTRAFTAPTSTPRRTGPGPAGNSSRAPTGRENVASETGTEPGGSAGSGPMKRTASAPMGRAAEVVAGRAGGPSAGGAAGPPRRPAPTASAPRTARVTVASRRPCPAVRAAVALRWPTGALSAPTSQLRTTPSIIPQSMANLAQGRGVRMRPGLGNQFRNAY